MRVLRVELDVQLGLTRKLSHSCNTQITKWRLVHTRTLAE